MVVQRSHLIVAAIQNRKKTCSNPTIDYRAEKGKEDNK